MVAATKHLVDVLPKFNEQFTLVAAKPFVAHFEGLEGIKKVHKFILEKRQPLKILASYVDRNNQTLRELIEKQAHKQKLLGIKHQAIVPAKYYKTTPEKQAEYKQTGIEVRKLENFDLPSQIVVFGDSVAMSALAPQLLTTYIENKAIAATMNILFDQLWEKAVDV
jgi:hypothetical protein